MVEPDFARDLERENAALRSQAIGQEETITRLQCTIKAAMHVEGQLQAENAALREELQQSEDRFRNIPDEVWSKADLVEMTNKALEERDDAHKQNAALERENTELRMAFDAQFDYQRKLRADRDRLDYLLEKCGSFVLEDYTTGNRDLYHIDATRPAIDAARAKEGQP